MQWITINCMEYILGVYLRIKIMDKIKVDHIWYLIDRASLVYIIRKNNQLNATIGSF